MNKQKCLKLFQKDKLKNFEKKKKKLKNLKKKEKIKKLIKKKKNK